MLLERLEQRINGWQHRIERGDLHAFTGQNAFFGLNAQNSCKAAAAEINKAGGIMGHSLTCSDYDAKGDPADAVPVTNRMRRQGDEHRPVGGGQHWRRLGLREPPGGEQRPSGRHRAPPRGIDPGQVRQRRRTSGRPEPGRLVVGITDSKYARRYCPSLARAPSARVLASANGSVIVSPA